MFHKTWYFAAWLQICKIWDFHDGSVTWVVSVKITDIWRNILSSFSRKNWKSSCSRSFREVVTFIADYMASCCTINIRNFKILLLGLEVVTFIADYMASCCRINIRNFKILLLGLEVVTFIADYMASYCIKNIRNFKILILRLVTLIHNPTTIDLCQKFWRTSTYVILNAAAIK